MALAVIGGGNNQNTLSVGENEELLYNLKPLADLIYPIGSLYFTQDQSFNPNQQFGGSLERIENKFIYAVSASASAGQQGGSSTQTLSVSNMPSHSHNGYTSYDGSHSHSIHEHDFYSPGSGNDNHDYVGAIQGGRHPIVGNTFDNPLTTNGSHRHSFTTDSAGSGIAFSIMPPYETAYCWKRIG